MANGQVAIAADMEQRAREAHARHAERAQEAADVREAEARRNAAMTPAELASEIVAKLRRRR